MAGPFTCHGCGDSWDTDPRLAVECPDCHAEPGSPCRSPSEHVCNGSFKQPHKARRELAFEQNPCSCLANWEREQQKERRPREEAPAGVQEEFAL